MRYQGALNKNFRSPIVHVQEYSSGVLAPPSLRSSPCEELELCLKPVGSSPSALRSEKWTLLGFWELSAFGLIIKVDMDLGLGFKLGFGGCSS